jgi:hypothetical protein
LWPSELTKHSSSALVGRSGDAGAYRVDGGLDTVLEVELREDAFDVVANGI